MSLFSKATGIHNPNPSGQSGGAGTPNPFGAKNPNDPFNFKGPNPTGTPDNTKNPPTDTPGFGSFNVNGIKGIVAPTITDEQKAGISDTLTALTDFKPDTASLAGLETYINGTGKTQQAIATMASTVDTKAQNVSSTGGANVTNISGLTGATVSNAQAGNIDMNALQQAIAFQAQNPGQINAQQAGGVNIGGRGADAQAGISGLRALAGRNGLSQADELAFQSQIATPAQRAFQQALKESGRSFAGQGGFFGSERVLQDTVASKNLQQQLLAGRSKFAREAQDRQLQATGQLAQIAGGQDIQQAIAQGNISNQAGIENARLGTQARIEQARLGTQVDLANAQASSNASNINAGSFNAALSENAQLNTQTSISNANNATKVDIFNSDQAAQTAQLNAAAANKASIYNSQKDATVALANAEAQNKANLAYSSAINSANISNANNAITVNLANAREQNKADADKLAAKLSYSKLVQDGNIATTNAKLQALLGKKGLLSIPQFENIAKGADAPKDNSLITTGITAAAIVAAAIIAA